jgi:hypothetical protein
MKKLLLILAIAVFLTGFAYAGTIHVTYPNGGENLCKGAVCTITWTLTGVTAPLKVVLVKGGTKVGEIAAGLPAGTTSYSWTVGNYIGGTAPTGTDYTIRVRDNSDAPPTDDDFSDAYFTIKNCVTHIDPNKYKLTQRIPCHFPGPGCPGCPPEFDLAKLRERIGDPAENLRLFLLKNGQRILDLGSFGKGRGLPETISGKLSEADLGLLKNGKGRFALGLFGADGKLRGSYPVEVQ